MTQRSRRRNGFTLIELLVVIAIIGIISAIGIQQINGARERARDAQRLTDMRTIEVALRAYILDHNGIPDNLPGYGTGGDFDRGCQTSDGGFTGDWDRSNTESADDADALPFIQFLVQERYLDHVPLDPLNDKKPGTSGCTPGTGHTYVFFIKSPGYGGCPAEKGKFFLLGVSDMESSSGPHRTSPRFRCNASGPSYNGTPYSDYFEWMDGIFEKDL
jgi:prepilin-type N-terminal cleavage/methylation domain-containing protein